MATRSKLSAPIGSNEVIISSKNYKDFLPGGASDHGRKTGLRPPSYSKYAMRALCGVVGSFDVPLIPQSEYEDRLKQQITDKSQLSDVRNRGMDGSVMPSRDQNGRGYCWAHSSTSAALIVRASMNQPYADLSAYAVACIIKNFQDEGGWGEESLKFIADRGIPTSKTWPQQGTKRSYDNSETWAEAAHYKFSTEWMALDSSNMKAQLITCCLLGIPVVTDLNWWSHSICTLDIVSFSPFRTRIWNSWGDSWSENGTGILEGSKAIPDDALAPRVMLASL